MTVGELALLFKHAFGYGCALIVIPMEGWNRSMYFDDTGLFWVPPSPNTTSIDMNILYTGTCLVEGTNLSEGRGATKPFESICDPFINGHAVEKKFNANRVTVVLTCPHSF